MTPEQGALIRKSFDATWPVRRTLADLCYSRFFELAPDARGMFPNDMERQRLKLMDMIAALVGALDQRELFQSLITHSGRQHAAFGVKPAQYIAFGEALIWSFERQFGEAFTPDLRDAWTALYASARRNGAGRRPAIELKPRIRAYLDRIASKPAPRTLSSIGLVR
jgi:hemoglobin-like flavoprotein